MTEPILMMMLEHSSFLGAAEQVEERVRPLDEQLNFGPGDTAILATANSPLEQEFAVLRGVDPTKHAETYPDWEERMSLRDHVLCEHFSSQDPEITLGWFHRLKLMPIKKHRYWECRRWLKEGFPDEPPDWVDQNTAKYNQLLADQAPEIVPHRAVCPSCGGTEVELRVSRTWTYVARAGGLTREGAEVYLPMSEVEQTDSHEAKLVCPGCQSWATLEDQEWNLPGISN